MRIITFTNLYPSRDEPRRGVFVEERLRQLTAGGRLDARVVALRPGAACWRAGPRAAGRVLGTERRHGLAVEYVGVPTLPGATNWVDPWLWARATWRSVQRQLDGGVLRNADGVLRNAEGRLRNGDAVLLDAHFLYPDAVAAVLVGRRLGLPVVMTARGSDVNVKCGHPVMRAWMRWAVRRSAALITVSRALRDTLEARGVTASVMEVLPNGVDLARFRPLDRYAERARLGVRGRVVASVGNLVDGKGHDIAIEAAAGLAGSTLLIVGEGPRLPALRRLAERLGAAERVRFLGAVAHEDMPRIYNAADALVLASAREGMPNVVLESLACGTRVVATAVGGVGEVLTCEAAGQLVRARSAAALREALQRLFGCDVSREQTRDFAARFGWPAVIERQLALYRRVAAVTAEPRIDAELGLP